MKTASVSILLFTVSSSGCLQTGDSPTTPVGGMLHAEFVAVSGANTRADPMDADHVGGSTVRAAMEGGYLTTLSGRDDVGGGDTGSRSVVVTFGDRPTAGNVYTLGAGQNLVEFDDDTSYAGGGERRWASSGGSITIESLDGARVGFSVAGASMQPSNGRAVGTFTLAVRGRVDAVKSAP